MALIWRPHQWIESTIKSMRPKLWEEYSKIVEQYKLEGWEIYDDTPDIQRQVNTFFQSTGSILLRTTVTDINWSKKFLTDFSFKLTAQGITVLTVFAERSKLFMGTFLTQI